MRSPGKKIARKETRGGVREKEKVCGTGRTFSRAHVCDKATRRELLTSYHHVVLIVTFLRGGFFSLFFFMFYVSSCGKRETVSVRMEGSNIITEPENTMWQVAPISILFFFFHTLFADKCRFAPRRTSLLHSFPFRKNCRLSTGKINRKQQQQQQQHTCLDLAQKCSQRGLRIAPRPPGTTCRLSMRTTQISEVRSLPHRPHGNTTCRLLSVAVPAQRSERPRPLCVAAGHSPSSCRPESTPRSHERTQRTTMTTRPTCTSIPLMTSSVFSMSRATARGRTVTRV